MKQDFPERKKLRLSGHDYSSAGAYFVTIRIKNPAIRLSEIKIPYSPSIALTSVTSRITAPPTSRITVNRWYN